MHKVEFPPEVMQRVIARQGKPLANDRLAPRRTALIVVDMQNYFVAPGEPSETPITREITPNINRLATALRDAGGLVVWIATEAPDDCATSWPSLRAICTEQSFAQRQAALRPGTFSYAFWHALDVRPGDPVIVKNRYSAFIKGASGLEGMLRGVGVGVDTVLITGVGTSVCCESTARDAMMLNFNTVMVSDALAAKTDAVHNATLATFYMYFGDVQTTDQVIAALAAGSRAAAE